MSTSNIFYYAITLSYNGSGHYGWQIQNNAPEKTIQQELNCALKKICKSEDIRTIGSGRTDAGVHALGQVVKLSIPLKIRTDSLMAAINSMLPKEIRVIKAESCLEDFHPIFHAKSKTYDYLFASEVNAFDHHFIAPFPYLFDIELMNKACKLFEGEHDFCAFYCVGTPVKSTIRTIFSCELIVEKHQTFVGTKEYYRFRVTGSGFMKQMVRLMVGTLWNVGRGKITLEQLNESLRGGDPTKLAAVAPPEGLYLVEVIY